MEVEPPPILVIMTMEQVVMEVEEHNLLVEQVVRTKMVHLVHSKVDQPVPHCVVETMVLLLALLERQMTKPMVAAEVAEAISVVAAEEDPPVLVVLTLAVAEEVHHT